MSACCGRHRDVLLLPPSGKDLLPCWKGVLSRNISIFAAISGSASAPVKVKVTQSCLTLQTLGILEARILEWVAFPFSRGSSQPRSPTLQADPLPAEPQGKPLVKLALCKHTMCYSSKSYSWPDITNNNIKCSTNIIFLSDPTRLSVTTGLWCREYYPHFKEKLNSSLESKCLPRIPQMKVKVAQSCPALCDPMDCTVHGIIQASILEW